MNYRHWLRNIACGAFVLLGFAQIIGYATGSRALRGLGATFAASPLPLVFTQVKGVETFASRFDVEYRLPDGSEHKTRVTRELYSRLGGAYNWRNVYGAAMAYGPVLPPRIRDSVLRHAFCRGGLTRRMGIAPDPVFTRLYITTRTRGRDDRWRIDIDCAKNPGDTSRAGSTDAGAAGGELVPSRGEPWKSWEYELQGGEA